MTNISTTSGEEKTRSQTFLFIVRARNRAGNGGLSGPGEAVQPENTLVLLSREPTFNLPQYICPCSPQAALPVPTPIPSVCGTMNAVEEGEVRRFLYIG